MSAKPEEKIIENEEERRLPIYILFLALGVLTILPNSFFFTATDYWMYKFRDTSGVNHTSNSHKRTDLQTHFISNYVIVAECVMAISLLLTIFFLTKRVSMMVRLVTSMVLIIAVFVFTIVFTMIDTDQWQQTFYILALASGFIISGSTAVFMVYLFELVVRFPSGYLGALLSGQSICGILAALLQIASLGLDVSSKVEGLIYFLCGGLFVFGTTCGFFISLKTSSYFYENFTKKFEEPQVKQNTSFLHVVNKTKYYLLSIMIVMGSSVMVHPGMTALVVSQNKGSGSKWSDTFFVPVITFLLFNIGAFGGRELANVLRKPKNDLAILALTICRTALVPLIMFCNVQPRRHLSVLFNEDFVYIIFIIMFSFTYGYCVNLCVVQVPTITSNVGERKIAMVLLVLLMFLSSAAFSFVNSALVKSL